MRSIHKDFDRKPGGGSQVVYTEYGVYNLRIIPHLQIRAEYESYDPRSSSFLSFSKNILQVAISNTRSQPSHVKA